MNPVKRFLECWASRIDIADEFKKLEQQMEYASIFEPVLLPDGTLPESERMSRGRDFEEAYKEIFGLSMEEAFGIEQALRIYEEEEDEGQADLRVV